MTVDTTVNPGHSESVLLAQILQVLLDGGGGGGGTSPTLITSGQVQLSGGTATITNPGILATSKVAFSVTSPLNNGFITPQASAGHVVFFSSNNTDTSLINYDILA